MEFFDFTGTNEDEKAEALNIITHNESTGVEFFLEYEDLDIYSPNLNFNNYKPYVHVNGILSPQSIENDIQQSDESNSFNSSQLSNANQAIQNNTNQSFTSQSNWDLNGLNNPPSNSAILAPHMHIQPNGASPPVVCAAPYIFHQTPAPYFAPYVPSMPHGAIPALAPLPLNSLSNQNNLKDIKSLRMPLNSSINTSSAQKNSSKIAAASNCDNRNTLYIPNHHYPDSSQLVDNNRLNTSSISVSGDGGPIMSESGALVTNGSAVGVPPHLVHPHHQHPSYGYPHFHPQAAFLPTFNPQLYFIPDQNYLQHYQHFAPNITLPPNHHQNVMTSPNSSNDIAPQSGHIPSTMLTSTASSATTALSNLSSSVSASSTSIAAAYHSSQSSQSGTPTSFDPTEDSNIAINSSNSLVYIGETSNENVNINETPDRLTYLGADEIKQVPLQPDQSNVQPPVPVNFYQSSFPSLESQTQSEISNQQNWSTSNDDNTDSMNKVLSTINIINKSNVAKNVSHTEATNILNSSPISSLSNNSLPPSTAQSFETKFESSELIDQGPSSVCDDDISSPLPVETESNKNPRSTWASKLFGSTSSAESNQNKSNTVIKPVALGDIEAKPDLTNGDFPELSNFKPVNSQNNRYKNRHSIMNVEDTSKIAIIPMKEDPVARRLAKNLRDSIHLKHSLPTIMPCGLVNRGNWCYVNATLQALLACPPFYNLMREIGETGGIFRQGTSTPIIDNFARYFYRFIPTDFKRQMKTAGSSAISYLEELLNNDPFEPTCIYDTLKHIGMIKNDAQRGHQEDAEEFLSSVLNGLHEEMINLSNLLSDLENNQKDKITKSNGFSHDLPDNDGLFVDEDASDANDNIWHEVGTSKHKALPTRSAKVISTAITEIFGGSTLDVRTVNKDKDTCGNRQPFFALQLDIKPSGIKNLEDAIRFQTKPEAILDYTCSKTKQIVEASRQMFLETVPPILILHLKLFEYDVETGAGRKVLKRIDFSENLDIPRECFPRNNDSRHCKRYKLLGVVYHNGSEAMKGHYVTDVYHLGLNQWLRCDDASIKVISISQVLSNGDSGGNMVPYLLFYRRQDTLGYSNSSSSNVATANNISSSYSANMNGNKFKSNDHSAHHHSNSHNQHTEVTINTSNKFSYISRHN